MSALGWAALGVVSVCAFDAGFLLTLWLTRRHYRKSLCHFCDLYQAQAGDLYCSAVCADADLGLLGVTQ